MKLAGIAEIAEAVKVSRPRARQLADRDDFPEPLDRLRMGPVYKMADVEKWIRKHRAGVSVLVAALLALVAAPAAAGATVARVERASPKPVAAEVLTQNRRLVLTLADGTMGPQPYQAWADRAARRVKMPR